MKNTQKISRENLKEIYKSDIGRLKDKVASILIDSCNNEIEISNETINQAYKEANSNQKKLIEKYFKIVKVQSLFDRIDGTLESIYKILNIKESGFLPYQKENLTYEEERINNIARLQKVALVYNGSWQQKFDGNQRNYYSWFLCDSGAWVVLSDSTFDCGSVLVYFETSEKALDAGNKFFWLYKKINNLVD